MKARYYGIGAAMVAAAAIVFFWVLPDLPARVPVHWNVHGEVDRWGSPWTLFWTGPGLMAGMMALFALLPWLSPRRFEVDASLRTYLRFMLILLAVFGYIFGVTLYAATVSPVGTDRAVIGGICLLAVLLGNLMGKVPRNFYIGIRTPWTLADERVWHATHRFAGWLLVGAGLLALAALLLGAPAWVSVAVVTTGFLLPVLHSLLVYKGLERRGELN